MFFGRENPPAASRYPPLTRGGFGGRGKSLSPLSRCARQLPLIRGVVPSPTGFKDTFRVWVGEALGPPANPWKPGGPVCRPYGSTRVHLSNERAGEGTRPYGESGSNFFFFVGAGHWPARRILKYDKSKQGRPDGAAPVLLACENNTSMKRS